MFRIKMNFILRPAVALRGFADEVKVHKEDNGNVYSFSNEKQLIAFRAKFKQHEVEM